MRKDLMPASSLERVGTYGEGAEPRPVSRVSMGSFSTRFSRFLDGHAPLYAGGSIRTVPEIPSGEIRVRRGVGLPELDAVDDGDDEDYGSVARAQLGLEHLDRLLPEGKRPLAPVREVHHAHLVAVAVRLYEYSFFLYVFESGEGLLETYEEARRGAQVIEEERRVCARGERDIGLLHPPRHDARCGAAGQPDNRNHLRKFECFAFCVLALPARSPSCIYRTAPGAAAIRRVGLGCARAGCAPPRLRVGWPRRLRR